MPLSRSLPFALLLAQATVASAEPPAPPGVPLELATARRAAIASVAYDLHFDVPGERSREITGRNLVVVTLREVSRPLVLDFAPDRGRVRSASANGTPIPTDLVNGHLVVPVAALRRGENRLTVEFVAGDGPLNRSDDFLYTLFVPARAHRAFPCFDQPDLKARVALSLALPGEWSVVANGAEAARETREGRLHVRFVETAPLPTYLIAFAAGRLKVETAERDGRTLRMFHRETDQARVARNRDAIFDLHAQALAWLERYTGIPYPWGKFDFFLVPAFQFGGMEHAGAIFYNAPGLLLDESATQAQVLGRASLIAHETAHMWFGDLVTMRWFDDVWMKEVFANFFAAKIVNPAFPAIDHDLRFLFAHYPAAYEIDRSAGTHAIRPPLDNLENAGTLYGAIIYQKAPVVMRQLERMLGEAPFREGMREYLAAHSFANASWPDLIAVLDAKTPVDLAAWSRAWVEEAGRPIVRTELSLDAAGTIRSLALVQVDPSGRGRTWPQAIDVVVAAAGGGRTLPVTLDAARVEVREAAGLPSPRFVLPTGGELGYGDFDLDAASRARLFDELPSLQPALTRGAVMVTLWEDVLQRRATAGQWMDLALRALPGESDELNLTRLLGYTSAAFWRHLPAAAREARAPELERVIRAGLDSAKTRTAKAAWFQALTRLARTPDTVAWMERVWRREEKVEGLPIAEPDEIALAQELAVREIPAWREVLEAQSARIANADRKARFDFVRPALDADPLARDRFFDGLADVANRRREPWVLEALSYLHHPLRAARSQRYVPRSLDMLEEIQRTGDIFFPKRWTDATLSGHCSAEVAGMVRDYLRRRPDLSPRLRRIVEQSADELFRIAGEGRAVAAPAGERR